MPSINDVSSEGEGGGLPSKPIYYISLYNAKFLISLIVTRVSACNYMVYAKTVYRKVASINVCHYAIAVFAT